MFTNQLSTENLRRWLDENGYDPLQIHWIIYYSQRTDVSPLMNKTFSPAKTRLLGSLIYNGIDAEHLINLKAEDTVWYSMIRVINYYSDACRIEEKRGNIVVYDNHNRLEPIPRKHGKYCIKPYKNNGNIREHGWNKYNHQC